jgi:ATP-dependent Clp protease protease subunit
MPYGIEVTNKDADVGEITIYGYITDEKWFDDDVTPQDFKKEMDKLKNKKRVNVYINSGGGGVFAGIAIHNMIKRLSAETVGYVDGMAASIASVILQGCTKRVVSKGSMVMIHNPAAVVAGEADEMRKTADLLDKIKTVIIDTYRERTKTSESEISQMMNDETWMKADEAVAFGFADELADDKKVTASIRGTTATINGVEMDLNRFRAFPVDEIKTEEPPEQPQITPEPDNSAEGFLIDKQIQINNLSTKLLEVL